MPPRAVRLGVPPHGPKELFVPDDKRVPQQQARRDVFIPFLHEC